MEKHVYQVGDKVVMNFPNNDDGKGERWNGGAIGYAFDLEKGQVVTLKEKWADHEDAWGIQESRWVYDERAFSPYKEPVEIPKPILLKDLRIQASKQGIVNYSRFSKKDLQELLNKRQNIAPPLAPPKPVAPSLGEELRKKTGDVPGTCSYALEFSNGTRRFQVKDVCHARLRKKSSYEAGYEEEKKNNVVAAVCDIAGHYHVAPDKEAYKQAIVYLLNDSPYKQVYITKSWDDALREGVYLNVTKESNSHCVTGAIALREASEFPKQTEMFSYLVKSGFSLSASWFAARHFKKNGDKITYNAHAGGHATISFSMDYAELITFWKKGFFRKVGEPMSKKADGYEVFESIAKHYVLKNTLNDFLLKTFSPPEEKGWGVDPDPFPLRNLFNGMEIIEKELA